LIQEMDYGRWNVTIIEALCYVNVTSGNRFTRPEFRFSLSLSRSFACYSILFREES